MCLFYVGITQGLKTKLGLTPAKATVTIGQAMTCEVIDYLEELVG